MAVKLDCPSCGASVSAPKGVASVTCPYCGNLVMLSEYPVDKTVTSNRVPASGKSCGKTAIIIFFVSILLVIGVSGLIFYFVASTKERASKSIASIASSEVTADMGSHVVMEFGGSGSDSGRFQSPECIALDAAGHIYVGEFENGRVQIFNTDGDFIDEWFYTQEEDVYLSAMSASGDGIVYAVFNSSLFIFDGETGDRMGAMEHPEGWGFEDVDVAPDGSILASWYKNRDDIILFNTSGEVELIIEEAISSQTGDSELSTMIALGNTGEIYAYGSFNEVVMIFNRDGRFIDRFGNDEMFIMPAGMDVDPMGRLWVTDFGDLLLLGDRGELIERIQLGNSIYDFVISEDMQLYGITADETIVQLDLTSY